MLPMPERLLITLLQCCQRFYWALQWLLVLYHQGLTWVGSQQRYLSDFTVWCCTVSEADDRLMPMYINKCIYLFNYINSCLNQAVGLLDFVFWRLDPNKNLSACSCMVRMIVLCNILSSSHQYHHISQNITSGVVQRPKSISATLTDF